MGRNREHGPVSVLRGRGNARQKARAAALRWLWFVGGLLLVEIVDAGADIIRGDLFPPSYRLALHNAIRVVHFESAHGFFVEPDLYSYTQREHTFLGTTVGGHLFLVAANNLYAFFHIGIPILVAGWIYLKHRNIFGLLIGALILADLVALVGYFVFPVTPPRLTIGVVVHGHAVHFHNTMPYPKNGILVNGRPLGFNPYAAMPSLHIAWATIVALAVWLLSTSIVLRVAAAFYPIVMTLAIVLTANHYIMDAVGGLLTVCLVVPLLLGFVWLTGIHSAFKVTSPT